MIYEFKGVQYLIDIASKMREMALLGVKAQNKDVEQSTEATSETKLVT
jgi:hypothetical protein